MENKIPRIKAEENISNLEEKILRSDPTIKKLNKKLDWFFAEIKNLRNNRKNN